MRHDSLQLLNRTIKVNLKVIGGANAVIVTFIPTGYGNLLNLEATLTAVESGAPTFFIEDILTTRRDFTVMKCKT